MIEILMGMGLVLLLGAGGTVAYMRAQRRQAMDGAREIVVGGLRKAQANAASGVKDGAACGANVLSGWRVMFEATNYTVAGECGAVVFGSRSGNYSEFGGITATGVPIPNPILFRVLNAGTNVIGSTTITLSGFGLTRMVRVSSGGEIQ